MATDPAPLREEELRKALAQLEGALDLLDRWQAPAQIGARLDLVICELKNEIEGGAATRQ